MNGEYQREVLFIFFHITLHYSMKTFHIFIQDNECGYGKYQMWSFGLYVPTKPAAKTKERQKESS